MIDWRKISSSEFEKLSYEIISDMYPSVEWTPTKETHDGNKDGEAIYNAPLDVTIKYWYEAKFSNDVSSSIPKSHLDSTLVSCILDGKVVEIAFITNAYISEDYQRRATIFSKQRDNLKIIYINGDEVENWLSNHPEIEYKYFESNSAKHMIFTNQIRKFGILQNYSNEGNSFYRTNDMIINKEYILYISFYSSVDQIVSIESRNNVIEFIPNENKKYDQYDCLLANKGMNSFFIPISVTSRTKHPLSFILNCNGENQSFEIKNIHILDVYNPYIIHGSQIQIQQNLFLIINSNDKYNSIFFILAQAGGGKSFLLDSVYNNSLNPFSTHVFSFSGNESKDLLLCYKIIITSLYGEIWECIDDTILNMHFSEIERIMIQQINQYQITPGVRDEIISYYKSHQFIIDANNTQNQILIDDYHKLSISNQNLLSSFFSWFVKQKMNSKLFIFSRPDVSIPKFITQSFVISNINYNDIEATVRSCFKSLLNLPKLIRKYPLPLNILQFSTMLNSIHEKEAELKNKNEFEVELQLNQIYREAIQTTNFTLGNRTLKAYENNVLVYIIYKISTGISHIALSYYFGESIYSEIFKLCEKKIIKESNNSLLPYHDIYISAFGLVKSNLCDKTLEKFVLYAQKNGYISKSKMFSVLIDIGNECFWKYRQQASEYRDLLHNCADYTGALEIAKMLQKCNKKILNDYSYEDCQNLFVMANCIKYTTSYDQANEEFSVIKKIYEATRNDNFLDLFLESQTEIINNHIWMLNIKEALRILDEIKPLLDELYQRKMIVGKHLVNAFLNYYNRKMFINHMIDKGAAFDYKEAIRFSKELNRDEYIAFAKMDYAKSLYDQDLDKALKLLSEAHQFFITVNEKRRELDAESEICFIKDLINGDISYNSYAFIKKEMICNNYIQSKIKIQLKLIILRLLFGNESSQNIRDDLDSISINNTSIFSGKRHQAFINHIYAATYYKECNFTMSKNYSNKSLYLMKELGEAYTKVHNNNIELTGYKGFSIINNENCDDSSFIIDIRVW